MPTREEGHLIDDSALYFPKILYGRKTQQASLLAAWHRTKGGSSEFTIIGGSAGVGKSAIVHSLRGLIPAAVQFFSSKTDQYKRGIPYSAFLAIFSDMIHTVISDTEEKRFRFQKTLSLALGDDASILSPIIPDLCQLIPVKRQLQRNTAEDADIRLQLLLEKFIGCFISPKKPLILFLDDLHWADAASCRFLHFLFSSATLKYILIISAYRQDEIKENHALKKTLSYLQDNKPPAHTFELENLSIGNIGKLLASTMHTSEKRVAPFVKLLFAKTRGNPFFIFQFLQTLHRGGSLYFDISKGQWRWDIDKISRSSCSEDVIKLIIAHLKSMPVSVQQYASLAACMGNSFKQQHLNALFGEQSAAQQAVEILCHEGFFCTRDNATSGKDLAFIHDRVQQAAYFLMPEKERQKQHMRIGFFWHKHLAGVEEAGYLYEICDQFLHADSLSHCHEKAAKLARLFLTAGQSVLAANALDVAQNYFEAGIKHLNCANWSKRYRLTFNLLFCQARCAYLQGNSTAAKEQLETLLTRKPQPDDSAKIHMALVELYEHMGEPKKAIASGLEGLKAINASFPKLPYKIKLGLNLLSLRYKLRERALPQLEKLPILTEQSTKIVLHLYASMVPSAYYVNQDLLVLLISELILKSLKHGKTDDSLYAFIAHAGIEGAVFGRYNFGRKLADHTLRLLNELEDTNLHCTVLFIFGAMINGWTRHISTSLPVLERAFLAGKKAGNLTYSGYAATSTTAVMFFQGLPLAQVFAALERYGPFHQKTKFKEVEREHLAVRQAVLLLLNKTESNTSFSDPQFNEARELHLMRHNTMQTPLYWYYCFKLQTLCLFGHYDKACRLAAVSDARIFTEMLGMFHVAIHCFYYALAAAGKANHTVGLERFKCRRIIQVNCQKIRRWATFCPENFSHKYLLIEGEKARLATHTIKAFRFYDQAIEGAQENDFIHEAALGCEIAGRYALETGMRESARHYLRKAYLLYSEWGAMAKCQQLLTEFKKILDVQHIEGQNDELQAKVINETAIISAVTLLSREMDHIKLCQKLLEIVSGICRARKILLLLKEDGKYVAKGRAEDGIITIFPEKEERSVEGNVIPKSILQDIDQKRVPVFINNNLSASSRKDDSSFDKQQPSAILCLPIFFKKIVAGALYLEDQTGITQTSDALLNVLKTIVHQFAISLENARLYASVAQLNAGLTEEIANRYKMEENLEASDQRYRLLAENVSDVIWTMNLNLQYTYTSPSITELLGFSVEEAMAKKLQQLLYKNSYEIAMSAFEEEMQEEKNLVRNPARTRILELELHRKDHGTVWTESKISLLYDNRNKLNGFLGITRDISERKEAEKVQEKSRIQLQNLSSHLQSIREDEKTRIARDVHDELGQSLTALDMDVAWLKKHLPENDPILQQKTAAMARIIETTISSVQRICSELRPAVLDHFGLGAAIEWQIAEFTKRCGISCQLEGSNDVIDLEKQGATALFRICQETLTNVARHAMASQVKIRLENRAGVLSLEICDNGCGITDEQLQDAGSLGLLGMQERARHLGGDVIISKMADSGTRVYATIKIWRKKR